MITYNFYKSKIGQQTLSVDQITVKDFKMYISQKTNRTMNQFAVWVNYHIVNDDTIITSNDHVSILDNIDYCLLSQKGHGCSEIPDENIYELGACEIGNFKSKSGSHFPTLGSLTFKFTIFKIIKINDPTMLIKFFEPLQINWGSGPTLPSLYAWVNVQNKTIYPIYMESATMELFDKFPSYDVNTIKKSIKPITFNKCVVCLENKATMFTHCKTSHLACCEKCVTLVKKCPICRHVILNSTNVMCLE